LNHGIAACPGQPDLEVELGLGGNVEQSAGSRYGKYISFAVEMLEYLSEELEGELEK